MTATCAMHHLGNSEVCTFRRRAFRYYGSWIDPHCITCVSILAMLNYRLSTPTGLLSPGPHTITLFPILPVLLPFYGPCEVITYRINLANLQTDITDAIGSRNMWSHVGMKLKINGADGLHQLSIGHVFIVRMLSICAQDD